MILGLPGADLLGVNEQRIITILRSHEHGLHVRKIERLAATPHYTTGGILRRFTTAGLLSEQQIGTSLVYNINRNHAFWPAIEQLLDMRDMLITRINNIIEPLISTNTSVLLFGALVNGDTNPDASVDIAILYNDNVAQHTLEHVVEDLRQLGRQHIGNAVKVYTIDTPTLHEMVEDGEPLLDALRDEAELLTGETLDTWLP